MGVQICQASVFHSPGILAKLFSKKGRKMAAILASLLAIASLATAKPQVGFGFPSSSSPLTPLEQRVPNTCTIVRQHLCLPVRLQRGNPLPVHLLRFTNSMVCH